jgi:hypothetical protein
MKALYKGKTKKPVDEEKEEAEAKPQAEVIPAAENAANARDAMINTLVKSLVKDREDYMVDKIK